MGLAPSLAFVRKMLESCANRAGGVPTLQQLRCAPPVAPTSWGATGNRNSATPVPRHVGSKRPCRTAVTAKVWRSICEVTSRRIESSRTLG